jgi:Family of unknown function (DUF6011)
MHENSTTAETGHRFATVADAKLFTLAGNATITLESLKTGAHFTYRIREAKATHNETKEPVYFVSLLNGPDNENDYMYLGIVRAGAFTLTRNSKAGATASAVVAFKYFWSLQGETFPAQLIVRHEGRCGRCGRTLTVPSSIDLGIGPECAQLMGLDL